MIAAIGPPCHLAGCPAAIELGPHLARTMVTAPRRIALGDLEPEEAK
jgi:hypothetical protein